MKYTSIVIAALFGYTQAGIRLTRTDGSITYLPETLLIQIEESKIEEKDQKIVYHPGYDGFDGNKGPFGDWREPYERVVPDRFEGDTGDTFTKKMIKEYAIEAAVEVIGTHLGLFGAAATAHLDKYFDMVWEHFDVLKKGSLEAIELNHLMRDLCKPIKPFIYLE